MKVVYVPGPQVLDRDEGLKLAVRWLVTEAQANGGTPLVVVPVQGSAEHSPVLSALKGRIRIESQRTFRKSRWSGGPVLVAWPSRQFLEELVSWGRPSAVCVVQWVATETEDWLRGYGAQDLSGSAGASDKPDPGDAVVREALISLTHGVNLGTGLGHPSDRARAIETFQVLHGAGHPLKPSGIYQWALANGWSGMGATQLREIAEGVLARRRFRGAGRVLRSDVLDIWRNSAATRQAPES